MTPEFVRSKLWREGEDKHVYVILDGAQNETLLDVIDDSEGLEYECLMTDKLEPDMQEVAPYLVHLLEDAPFTKWLMKNGWAQNWGIFLTSKGDLGEVWRDMRQHVMVSDRQGKRLFFRFYDPRVLNAFLPTCDSKQLTEFFGRVDMFVAELEGGQGAHAFSLADDQLVTELVGKA
jgi:hypothetical protein